MSYTWCDNYIKCDNCGESYDRILHTKCNKCNNKPFSPDGKKGQIQALEELKEWMEKWDVEIEGGDDAFFILNNGLYFYLSGESGNGSYILQQKINELKNENKEN